MWSFKYISLKKFISHLDTHYQFENGIAVPIAGFNKTDEGQKGNGSGKSALIEGAIVVLTGTPFRSKSTKDIIMDYQDETEVEAELHNEITGVTMKIYRKIHVKKSAVVELYIDGVLRSDLKDLHPRETDKEIELLLGISFEDIRNYYVLSNDHHRPFFLETDSRKKAIVNRFSKADVVDLCIEQVKKDVIEKDREITDQERMMMKVESSIEALEENIADWIDSKQNLKTPNKDDEIAKQREVIDRENTHLTALRNFLSEKMDLLSKTQIESATENDSANKDHIHQYREKLKQLNVEENIIVSEKQQFIKSRTDYEKNIRKLEVILQGEIECPSCKYHFIPQSEVDPQQAKEHINQHIKEIEILKQDIESCEQDIADIELERKEFNDGIAEIEQKLSQIRFTQNLIDAIKDDITTTQKRIDNKCSLIADQQKLLKSIQNTIFIVNDPYTEQIEQAEEKITERRIELSREDQRLTQLRVSREEVDRWTTYFKQFKSHLANQAIGSIEGYTNYYLQKMHTNLQVKIDGFRMLADNKTIKEEINVEILRDNGASKAFERYSGGEKARVNVANILAMQQMINDTAVSGGLNFLGLDEVCESLDSIGVSSILHSLSCLKRTVLMINQVRIEALDNELVIMKENGISTLGRMYLDDNNEEIFKVL